MTNTRETRESLVKHEEGLIRPGQTFAWNQVPLLVPSAPPSDLDNCKMIDIDYFIQVA